VVWRFAPNPLWEPQMSREGSFHDHRRPRSKAKRADVPAPLESRTHGQKAAAPRWLLKRIMVTDRHLRETILQRTRFEWKDTPVTSKMDRNTFPN
jgi:hypothetical protein